MVRQTRRSLRSGTGLGVVALGLASGVNSSAAPEIKDRFVFCVPSEDGKWTVQNYPPLISLSRKTTFEEITYTATWLSRARIRHFEPEYELTFEYKFDQQGLLQGMHGFLRRWGRWIATANLHPKPDGTFEKSDVIYHARVNGDPISDPDDGPNFASKLITGTIYRNTQGIPCAAQLKAAAAK